MKDEFLNPDAVTGEIGGDLDNFTLDLEGVDENSGGFEALPAGIYDCIVEETEFGASSKGNPMITWKFKVIDEAYKNRLFFYHTVLNTEIGIANLKKTLVRVCPDVSLTGFNPASFCANGEALGLPCRVKVNIRPYNGEKRNNVKEVLAPEAGDAFIDG